MGGRHRLNLYLVPKGSTTVLITILPEYASPKVLILQEYLREPGELNHNPMLNSPDGLS